MNRHFLSSHALRSLAGCLVLALLVGDALRAAPEAIIATPGAEVTGEFWLGEEFVSQGRVEEGGFETVDYLPRGETLANWRQRVTVRRSVQAGNLDPALFLAGFREELGKDSAVQLEECGSAMGGRLLMVTRVGGAEGARFRSCVLILHSRDTGLVLVQYSQHPDRLDDSLGEIQMAAWRERLQGHPAGNSSSSSGPVAPAALTPSSHG